MEEDLSGPGTMAPGPSDPSFVYNCIDSSPEHVLTCPTNCTGLEDCLACECQVLFLTDTGGPWGQVMDFFFLISPIVYLVIVTVKPNPTDTTVSLPMSALIMFLVRLMYLGSNPLLTSACVVLGIHEAITPLTVMGGAIFLFETMEETKCLPFMMREMKALTNGHKVAEAMLIYGFATIVEGASGFGTPVALGAPMLVSTGNPPLESLVTMLVFNTFVTVWGKINAQCRVEPIQVSISYKRLLYLLLITGAVGTPLWFGFGSLNLSEEDLLEISFQSSIAMIISATILLPWILTVLIPFSVVRKNLIFLYLSIFSVMGPLVGLSFFSYEFPSLLAGLVGCILIAFLIKYKVGLAEQTHEDAMVLEAIKSSDGDVEEGVIDVNRGYNREITCLTDISLVAAKALTPLQLDECVPLETPPDAAAEEGGGSEERTAEKTADDIALKATSKATGNWNVEVQKENTEAPDVVEDDDTSRAVVYISPTISVTTNGEVEAAHLKEEENNCKNEGSDEQPLTASAKGQLVDPEALFQQTIQSNASIGQRMSTGREDALLGPRKSYAEGYVTDVIMRTFPIWAVVLTLILTRVPAFEIKGILTSQEPYWEVQFGTYGDFRLSAAVVLQLRNILTYPNLNWKYELLYVPFLIPFVLVSLLTMLIYRKDMTCRPRDIAGTVASRLRNPAIAIVGALVLVQLMLKNGKESPAYLLGTILADWLKGGFVAISPLVGALGSFFSGSTTVSNLTFGEIQRIAAKDIGISVNSMLALQAIGGSAGNGICLNNIIAGLTVVGLNVSEGLILKRTFKFVFSLTTIATVVMLAFFIRF
jgi:L-lactate permease